MYSLVSKKLTAVKKRPWPKKSIAKGVQTGLLAALAATSLFKTEIAIKLAMTYIWQSMLTTMYKMWR